MLNNTADFSDSFFADAMRRKALDDAIRNSAPAMPAAGASASAPAGDPQTMARAAFDGDGQPKLSAIVPRVDEPPVNFSVKGTDQMPAAQQQAATPPAPQPSLASYSPGFDLQNAYASLNAQAPLQPALAPDASNANAAATNPSMSRYVEPGPAQRQLQSLLQNGPEHPEADKHIGFGGRLMHFLKGGAYGVLASGNPFMFPLAGAISAVNPQFAHNLRYNAFDVPQSAQRAGLESRLQDESLKRVLQMAQATGRFPDTNELTPEGRYKQAQTANLGSEATRRAAETQHGVDQLGLTRYEKWAATAAPGTKVPDDIADGAHLPRGSTVWHNTQTGEHYIKGADGKTYFMQAGVGSVATDKQTGLPIVQPTTPTHEQQTPQYVNEGRARTELLKAHGITDENALVDNPAFAESFSQAKAAEEESSKRYGYPMPSDAEIAAQVAKKIPHKIKAGSLITPEMVKQRAAEIYQREHQSKPAAAPPSQPSQLHQLKAQRRQQEQLYQQNYNRLAPEKRAEFEQLFQQQFGRAPRKPAGAN